MKTRGFLDPQHKPKIDQGGGTSGKSLDGLVRPMHKLAKSLTEINNKVYKPLTYDETINDIVYGNKWREAINEEFWNLDSYQTWAYIFLSIERKAIGCNWVFKVKYYLDGSIQRYKG